MWKRPVDALRPTTVLTLSSPTELSHHIPDVITAQKEIARILKPGGHLIAMLYARRSLNYLLAIALVRRAGIAVLYLGRVRGSGLVGGHIANAKRVGLREYLRLSNFIHANTDGPLNPYSKVYDLSTINKDFSGFSGREKLSGLHARTTAACVLAQTPCGGSRLAPLGAFGSTQDVRLFPERQAPILARV